MKRNRQSLALFVVVTFLGAICSLGYAVLYPDHPFAVRGEMVRVAQNLALHGQFANPYPLRETGPTAVMAPAYSFFVATLLVLFGAHYAGMVMVLGTALTNGLHSALLIPLSRAVLRDQRPGLWAAVLAAGFPSIRLFPAWEAISAATVLLGYCIVSSHWLHKRSAEVGRAILLGAVAGFLVLLNPVVALVAMIWAGGLFHERWNNLQRPLAAAAGFGLMALAVPLPWVVRNQVVLGVPVIKNALGVNLHVSNNDCASSSFILNLRSGCLGKHSPDANRAEADLVADMGEGRYDAYRLNTAKSWISAHPGIFCRLTAQRVLEFWFPNVAEGPFAYTIATITLLSLAGFVLMARQDVLFLRFAVWTSLLYPLVYYVVFSDSRYRIPILWISLLGAGYCLQAWWERYCLWRRSRDNGRQAGASARHTAP